MKEENFYKLLAFSAALGAMDGGYNDFGLSERVRNYTISLVFNIDDLLNEGHSKEEILSIIKETDFTIKDPKLTKDEALYLQNYAIEILDIRYKLYLEHKDDKIDVIEIEPKELEENSIGLTKRLVKKNKTKMN